MSTGDRQKIGRTQIGVDKRRGGKAIGHLASCGGPGIITIGRGIN
jgi:hypothetical protein